MITTKVEIWSNKQQTWVNMTKYAVFPLKTGDFLDERLDEVYLQLIRCPYAVFPALTMAKITITNEREKYYTNDQYARIVARANDRVDISPGTRSEDGKMKITEILTINAILASDSAYRKPNTVNKYGDKVYSHDFYLIELTKIAEGFISDSITFTNELGAQYY